MGSEPLTMEDLQRVQRIPPNPKSLGPGCHVCGAHITDHGKHRDWHNQTGT